MHKRVVFFLAAALGVLLLGMIPLVAGVTAPPIAPSPGATWTLAPTNPEYIAYFADLAAGQKVSPIIPPRVDVRALADLRQLPPGPPPPPPPPGNQGFPSAYDLRTLDRVTPARLAKCGACWTSAALGSLESFFAPFEMWDFSEAHMQVNSNIDGATCSSGGFFDVATAYLAAWLGPVNEQDYSYKSGGPQNPPVQKHVQKVLYLPERQNPRDNDWVKLALVCFGGVYSNASGSFGANLNNHTYYNPVKYSGHTVTIVGWDDNFDRNKFFYEGPGVTEDQRIPPENGAFIAKDNQGPDWWEKGFFYISYYDKAIGSGMAVFTGEPATNYNRIYQYDPLGPTNILCLLNPLTPTYAANVFTAAADDNLTAVSFYNLYNPDMNGNVAAVDYEIKIYLDPPDGTPVSVVTNPVSAVKFSPLLDGYYTVKLPNKISLTKGQKFSVVLSGLRKNGGGTTVPIEQPEPSNHLGGATANPGESYVSPDGATWQDLTTVEVYDQGNMVPLTNTNACIKAFTTSKLSFSAWKAAGLANHLAWSFTNDSSTATTVKPVARLYRQSRHGFSRFGDEVDAAYYLDGRGIEHRARGGWVEVRPGETVTVYSERRALARADRVDYNYYSENPSGSHNSRLIRLADVWKHILLFESPLHVVSTSPMNNEQVNSPLSIITVTFDEEIKAGPSLGNISVRSAGVPSETKTTFNSVGGKTLYIALTAPINISQDAGSGPILWQVHLPSDAVTDLSGNPLNQDYSWSFTSGLAY